MKGPSLWTFVRVFLDRRSTWRLLGFTVCGFAFSQAVILGTIGLMDGFENALKEGLRRTAGDAVLTSRGGFFKIDFRLEERLRQGGVVAQAAILQTEAFALSNGASRGVLLRGIKPASFSAVTSLHIQPAEGVAVGSALAQEWNLRPGADLTLVLARGAESDIPQFLPLKVGQIVSHGMHEKDARMVYVDYDLLASSLGLVGKNNLMLLKFGSKTRTAADLERTVTTLSHELGMGWNVRSSWEEFSGILEAVQVEKTSIAVVLQLIVLVAVFNIAAFLITLRAGKAQEYFLFRAVGLPEKRFFVFGSILLTFVWGLSCVGACLLVALFDWLLAHASFLQVPGDIYIFSTLRLLLDFSDYVAVFVPALLWVALLGWLTARKLKREPLVMSLRQEFA